MLRLTLVYHGSDLRQYALKYCFHIRLHRDGSVVETEENTGRGGRETRTRGWMPRIDRGSVSVESNVSMELRFSACFGLETHLSAVW